MLNNERDIKKNLTITSLSQYTTIWCAQLFHLTLYALRFLNVILKKKELKKTVATFPQGFRIIRALDII